MKQMVILSGKGGTGKTITAAALAHLASQIAPVVLVDADVDAANLELVLNPERVARHDFRAGQVAAIDAETCTACGRCAEVCRFDAVIAGEAYQIDPLSCEGCASCYYQCPAEAVSMRDALAGEWYRSDTRFGPLFHAHLFAGQENSGKLVTMVRQHGRLLASEEKRELVLIDGPPGIGCPVIAASTGVDLALLVVEPTLSGIHDLERVLATTTHFGVKSLVMVNKSDINPDRAEQIAGFCREQNVEMAGCVPYDDIVTEAMVRGQPVTAYSDGPVSRSLRDVWDKVKRQLMA